MDAYSQEALRRLSDAGVRNAVVVDRLLEASVRAPDSFAACVAAPLFILHERHPGAYVMWDGDLEHPAKIGCAKNPHQRCLHLRGHLPYLGEDISELPDLDVVLVVLGYEDAERSLHRIFADHRLTGDWFKAEPVIRWVSWLGWLLDATDTLPIPMKRFAAEKAHAAGGRSAALADPSRTEKEVAAP
jgi:hypothetical protein